ATLTRQPGGAGELSPRAPRGERRRTALPRPVRGEAENRTPSPRSGRGGEPYSLAPFGERRRTVLPRPVGGEAENRTPSPRSGRRVTGRPRPARGEARRRAFPPRGRRGGGPDCLAAAGARAGAIAPP